MKSNRIHKILSVIMLAASCFVLLSTLMLGSCLEKGHNEPALEMVYPSEFELNGMSYEIDYDLSDIIYDRESGTYNFEKDDCVAVLINESECEAFSEEHPSITCIIDDSVYVCCLRNIIPVYSVKNFETTELLMICPFDTDGEAVFVGPDGGSIHDSYLLS